jgi:UDP-N-acetyl-alpha-D-quinovosamine dehydrogenase
MPRQAEVLVTGATGFIGSALVESLLRRGEAVRALGRRAAADGPAALRRVVVPDLRSHSDWRPLLDGVAAVVHLAGAAHLPRGADRSVFESSNAVATERLAAAAARAGVRRFVFVSSAKVNGERSGGRPLSEDAPVDPQDGYARSKLDAERRLLAVARSSSLETVILRPPLVYGPGVKANFLALLRLVDKGVPLPIAGIRNRRSLVYVGNLTSAIAACLAHPAAAGETFFVADEESVSTPELALALADALGRPARLFSVPPAVLGALASLAGQGERFRRVSESLELDTARIRSLLGWRAPHAFSEGIADTCRWFAASRR